MEGLIELNEEELMYACKNGNFKAVEALIAVELFGPTLFDIVMRSEERRVGKECA